MTLEAQLALWIEATCLQKNPQPRRVVELNRILVSVYNDRRFWKYRTSDNHAFYEDALSQMWEYFFRNLCTAAVTARKGKSFFDDRQYAVGRLLKYLQWRLFDFQKQPPQPKPTDGEIDPITIVPSPPPDPEALWLQAFLALLGEDPTGELRDEKNAMRGTCTNNPKTYELTAQRYLLMRHRDGLKIQEIADELDIPRGSLQGQRGKPLKWKELERKLAQLAWDSVVPEGLEYDPQ
jgi:hypothetical protein